MIKYTIYRFGKYIAEVEGPQALHKWILDNVPPKDWKIGRIPHDTSYKEALIIAKEQHYEIN